jgi:RNA polymerase sigma factor (TIGR02999 family)
LFAALYDELHRLAGRQLRRGGSNVTLSPTTLLHEAYLDMCGRDGSEFPDRARFIGYAARAMRGIVVDYVRHTHAAKRGGGEIDVTLTAAIAGAVAGDADPASKVERLSEALDALGAIEPELAELIDLHFFCGYDLREIADLRNVSERTVQRSWRKARLLLRHQLEESR